MWRDATFKVCDRERGSARCSARRRYHRVRRRRDHAGAKMKFAAKFKKVYVLRILMWRSKISKGGFHVEKLRTSLYKSLLEGFDGVCNGCNAMYCRRPGNKSASAESADCSLPLACGQEDGRRYSTVQGVEESMQGSH